MRLINIREWHLTYELIVGTSALCANFLLIYLALYKSGRHLRKYSLILIQSCIVDILFTILNMVLMPVVEMKDGNLFYMLGGPMEHLPRPYTCLFWMFFLEGLLICVINVPLQFIYRYLVLCKSIQMTVTQYLLTFCVGVVVVTIHCTIGFFVFYPTDQVIDTHKHLLSQDPIWSINTPDFIVGDKQDIISLLHFLNCVFIVNTSYGIVFWCSYKIYRAMNSLTNMSRSTMDAQSQITKILFVQALMPFIILSAPIIIVIFTSLSGKAIPALGICLALTISWMPIVNAFSAMFIVPSYRQWVFGLVGYKSSDVKSHDDKTTAINHQGSINGGSTQPQHSVF